MTPAPASPAPTIRAWFGVRSATIPPARFPTALPIRYIVVAEAART